LIGDIDFKKRFFNIINDIQGNLTTSNQKFNPLQELIPSFTDTLKTLVKNFHQNSKIVQKFLRFNDFIIHEYYLLKNEIDFKEINEEFGDINRNMFGKWNLKCLEILDKEKNYPIFLIKLLS
jgi:vacuolar-type H+-ATPase subunit I/STV1